MCVFTRPKLYSVEAMFNAYFLSSLFFLKKVLARRKIIRLKFGLATKSWNRISFFLRKEIETVHVTLFLIRYFKSYFFGRICLKKVREKNHSTQFPSDWNLDCLFVKPFFKQFFCKQKKRMKMFLKRCNTEHKEPAQHFNLPSQKHFCK